MLSLPRIDPQPPICSLEECKIAIVGEAPGKDEVPANCPFVGRAGRLLDSILVDADINRSLCYVTNVFLLRPPNNKVSHFFASRMQAKIKNEVIVEDLPPYNGQYLKEEYLSELERLSLEMEELKPKVSIILGATALWAFTGEKGITTKRGQLYDSSLVNGMKVLPTYHPSYILRNRHETDQVIKDCKYAKSIAEGI